MIWYRLNQSNIKLYEEYYWIVYYWIVELISNFWK